MLSKISISLRCLGAAILLAAVPLAEARQAAGNHETPTVDATWRNVAIGGGGYVTGLIFHPKAPGVIYTHTDVGGAYRWDAKARRWVELLDQLQPDHANWQGVESIAVDPQDASGRIVYAAVGEYAIDWAAPPNGEILKSTDGGVTWRATGLGKGWKSPLVDFSGVGIGSNWTQGHRERLVVDPNAPRVLYYASAGFGLWRSTDAAASWELVTTAPVGSTANIGQWGGASGIGFAAIDPASGRPGRPSQVIYVGVPGSNTDSFAGVWQSTDSGAHWQKLPGSPIAPQQGTVGPDGTFYVTHASGVMKWKNGQWTDITPLDIQQGYGSIAADPNDPNHLICNGFFWGFSNPIYVSSDGGQHWQTIEDTHQSNVPWWPSWFWAAAVSSIAFDPFRPGHVAYSDWYGVWKTDNINEQPSTWYTHEQGHEEVVALAMTSPWRGAPLLSGSADVGGFRHDSLDRFPARSFGLDLGLPDITGIDFSETDPSFLVCSGDNRSVAQADSVGYSTDGGRTWTPIKNTGAMGSAGVIAASATKHRIVWLPTGDVPYVSSDLGQTWTKSSGAPAGATYGNSPFVWLRPLATDRVAGDVAYLYDGVNNTGFYRSIDGGLTWSRTAASLPANAGGQFTVIAAPGIRGEVWLSLNSSGLFRSSDAGDHFVPVAGVSSADLVSFGAGRTPASKPTVFVLGVVNGERGVYRSEDLGANWTRIDTRGHGFATANTMQADRQVFGRVYFGTNGTGIFVGDSGDSR